MKSIHSLPLLLAILLPLAVHAATDLSTALQKGLFEEEANQNLPAAIQAYQALLSASDDQRKLAATALFRLGECYRKLGQTNDAIAQYQRLIRDFTDQPTLATLSRQNLTGLGVGPTPASSASISYTVMSTTSVEAEELARTERILAQISGLDFSQARRLLPTLVPDADSERYEKWLVDAQERAGQRTGEERDRWLKTEADYTAKLAERFEVIKRRLEDRVAQLRSEVAKQSAQAGKETSAAGAAQAATAGLRAEAVRADALLKQLQSMTRSEVIRVLPTVAPDELLNSLLDKRAQAERNLAALNVSFANTHPDVKAAEATLNNLHEQIAERFKGIMQGLEIKAATLKQQTDEPTGAAAPIDEEDQEIRRIQALIKDSPDLINAPNVEVTKVRSGELMVPKNGTLLHKAASLGQLRVAKYLLEHGAAPGVQDEVGRSPIHWAAENGHKAMVDLLLANKADVNAKISGWSGVGLTPLHLAVKKGYRTVCETLLARGADPNLGDASDTPPIYSAVSPGDEAILRLLLAKANLPPGKKGYALLHNAASTNIARILIDNGAIVDAQNTEEWTPLHTHARAGSREMVELLLGAGANPKAKDKAGMTSLHHAADTWKASVVGPLIAKGANPNERNAYGGVPLDLLIQFNDSRPRNASLTPQLETLEAFLTGGADPNLAGTGNAPPLFRAVAEGFEELAEALLKAGANPNAQTDHPYYNPNRKGQTPLIRALEGTKRSNANNSRTRSMPLVNLLLEHKADPSLPEGSGSTPLYYAIASGSQEFAEKVPFVEALLKRGADIEGRNAAGDTPLAVAVQYDMKEMVALLLQHKADPNAKTGSGETPLHLAAGKRNAEILELLLAAGATPNALNAQGLSALDYLKPTRPGSLPVGYGGLSGVPMPPTVPNFPGQQPPQRREGSQSELADRLRKAGARDWAPRPGQITVTRRSTGASIVAFSKGTNNWNRHSLLEVIGFTYFGSGSSFPFPDFSKVTITRIDPAGGVKESTVDLAAGVAADGCKADQWLEWGDLIDIPEGEHKLYEKWEGVQFEIMQSMTKCLTRNVTLTVKGKSKEVPLVVGSWRSSNGLGGNLAYYPERPFRLRSIVLDSGLLLTSSDTTRVKVTRSDAANGFKEWTFDLSKEPSAGNDLWLREGDRIAVPEK